MHCEALPRDVSFPSFRSGKVPATLAEGESLTGKTEDYVLKENLQRNNIDDTHA